MNTELPSVIGADKVMDVRPIPCSIKHSLILKTWRELPVGDHFVLLNDHDPVPLRYQFEAEFWEPNQAQWVKRYFANVPATTYTFDFVGKQPGRWRVAAVGAGGQVGPFSGWWGFVYTV